MYIRLSFVILLFSAILPFFQSVSRADSLLGFITVSDHVRFGLVGGFLVLNPVGRPVEFHCTAPLKPSRAHEVLFGNTLKPYLYGEQIAQTLIRRAQSSIGLFFTDTVEVLSLQDGVETPVLYVPTFLEEKTETVTPPPFSEKTVDPTDLFDYSAKQARPQRVAAPLKPVPGLNVAPWKEKNVEGTTLWIPEDQLKSYEEISNDLFSYAKSLDFSEPFSRIRLALEEAQK